MTADAIGGVWNYCLDLTASLASFEVDVVLAAMGSRPSAKQKAATADISNLTLLESDYKLEWMDSPWADVNAAGDWLLSLARTFEPDLIHLNGFAHASLSWNVPTMVVAHSCVRSWWAAVKGRSAPSSFNEYTERVSRGLHQASLVVAPSHAMLAAIDKEYSLIGPTKVIPNGCVRLYRRPSKKKEFILTAGRLWDEAKNVRLIEGIASNLSWLVYAAGESRSPSGGLQQLKHIHYLGSLSDEQLAAILATAPIYASPALYEPFGLTVLEAALSGCALVLSDIPSFRENWTDAAILIPPGDAPAWQDVLQEFIDNEKFRGELAQRALERAEKLQPEKVGERYFKAYCELLNAYEQSKPELTRL
jgi:glycosyltransferase involved in cell wall biosynthesis